MRRSKETLKVLWNRTSNEIGFILSEYACGGPECKEELIALRKQLHELEAELAEWTSSSKSTSTAD